MHALTPPDRPREKLDRHGVSALGDNELLALVLGHGSQQRDALDLANAILEAADGIHGLTRIRRDQLLRVAGVGPVHASRIRAAVELGRRTLVTPAIARPRFLTPRDTAHYLLPQFGSHAVERFGILLLDTRCGLLATRIVSVGSIDGSLAHPREVFREALGGAAAMLVAFHNHPSGDPTPSTEDVTLTMRLKQAGAIIGVELVDHVILADTKYCSMKEMGLI
ncbi:MAG: DNA repair protein RadC [Vicinamibacterales bacterium]